MLRAERIADHHEHRDDALFLRRQSVFHVYTPPFHLCQPPIIFPPSIDYYFRWLISFDMHAAAADYFRFLIAD
jgi:hypothetical protein